ncbi:MULTISPECIES: hypothetical protein [unclassified Roseateles]|uniref:DUF7010 family protein n=1 Tax=unclassified Roseateles TaxID=2626991 RepID=UPI0006F926F0|nr:MULTISPECIES: hypothetical protein [unclassified Roseateles]KQW45590.1 hypothetical protein ASC81_11870 [Pelomonas sp. Root405]KRA72434.1 hypothetical protein ASD88_11870 [Pelomonas sp. Root662]
MSTLDQELALFRQRRFLAMPLAGTLAWGAVAIAGTLLPPQAAYMALFICTGCIVYLGMALSKLTGENFMDKSRPKNRFDSLFMTGVAQAVLVYAIALPFYALDRSSLPLTVGILTGLMWLPFGWIIGSWVPAAHTVVRTVAILAVWLAFPAQRMVLVPLVIIAAYLPTMWWLERRWRGAAKTTPVLATA